MQRTTLDVINAGLRADPSLTPADRIGILAAVREYSRKEPQIAATAPAGPRIIRRAEAARILARSTRAIDLLAHQGTLQRVRLPGRSRGAGFRLADVERLIGGEG